MVYLQIGPKLATRLVPLVAKEHTDWFGDAQMHELIACINDQLNKRLAQHDLGSTPALNTALPASPALVRGETIEFVWYFSDTGAAQGLVLGTAEYHVAAKTLYAIVEPRARPHERRAAAPRFLGVPYEGRPAAEAGASIEAYFGAVPND